MIEALGIYGGAFAIGVGSCFVPIASIEVFLVGLVVARGPGSLASVAALVALATLGQILGKPSVYFATRGISNLDGRHRRWLDKLQGWLARTRCRPEIVLAASALLGLPPFALASTAAGALGIPPARFSLIIGVCRALRFVALIAIAARF